MKARIATLVGALALGLSACPPPTNNPDSGTDGGGGGTSGPCTGGCGQNQKCDEKSHQCIDGCTVCDGGMCSGCDAGICVKNAANTFQCVPTTTSCNNAVCGAGQAACVGGTCSCLPFTRASKDSCASEGGICNGVYDPSLATGGTCDAPKIYEACRTVDCPSGTCASCPAGAACVSVYESLGNFCTRSCTATTQCDRGELCTGAVYSNFDVGCLPFGVLGSEFACAQKAPADAGVLADGGPGPDAGLVVFEVPASNTCLLRDDHGLPTQDVATGNCTYDFFRFSSQVISIATCKLPGGAGAGQTCKREASAATVALQCGTGFECALTRGDTGQCLKMCNAATPRWGYTPQPACGTDETCVNLYRLEDPNAVVGVCMKSCDVFSTTAGTCADVGAVHASCIPAPADGRSLVSSDGTGVCVPQKETVAALGEACAETDAFKGAACASGLVCRVAAGSTTATCAQPCDVSCAVASPPARCATEPNAACSAGKACQKVTTTTGANLGFCQQ